MAWHKPYMFLMNTHYDDFGPELVERYMQRCLFYGMFPGFFSEDASTNPYFGNPKWYSRDRHLFRKYMPVIQQVAEAGWEPITRATTSDSDVWVERFGQRAATGLFFTILNTTNEPRQVRVQFEDNLGEGVLATDLTNPENHRSLAPLTLSLQPEEVRAIRVEPPASTR